MVHMYQDIDVASQQTLMHYGCNMCSSRYLFSIYIPFLICYRLLRAMVFSLCSYLLPCCSIHTFLLVLSLFALAMLVLPLRFSYSILLRLILVVMHISNNLYVCIWISVRSVCIWMLTLLVFIVSRSLFVLLSFQISLLCLTIAAFMSCCCICPFYICSFLRYYNTFSIILS